MRTDDDPASRNVGGLPAALEAAYDEAVLAVRFEVRQQLRDRLSDDAPPVDRDAMVGAQDQPRMLEAEQLVP